LAGDERTMSMSGRKIALLFGAILAVAIALSLSRGGPAQPRSAAGGNPVTVSGQGTKNTDAFVLAGGNYRVAWTAQADTHVGCYHAAYLTPASGGRSQDLGSGGLDDATPRGDVTSLYGLPGGSYYVAAISGCSWTITITPAP
jgi:hypothetical protein